MIDNIKLTIENYEFDFVKKEYELKNSEIKYVNETFYYNATYKETVNFFKHLGSSEFVLKANTKFGRKVVKYIRTSPNSELKTIRYFDFNNAAEV